MEFTVAKSQDKIPGSSACSQHSLYSLIEAPNQIEQIKIVPPLEYETSLFQKISLIGQWKRKADLGNVDSTVTQTDFDDFNWSNVWVPNNYGLEGELQRHFGPVWYRKKFQLDTPNFIELHFQAVDYFAEMWLNGTKLGDHEGYFAPFYFDITPLTNSHNILVVKVTDPCENLDPKGDWISHRKKYIKGTLNYHDSRPGGFPGKMSPKWSSEWGQSLPTGGITQPVYLKCTGPISLFNIFITPLDLNGLVHVALILENKGDEKVETVLNIQIVDSNSEKGEVAIKAIQAIQADIEPGANRIDLELQLKEAKLWVPQSSEFEAISNLYEMKIQAIWEKTLSDELTSSFGIRIATINPNPWTFLLNEQYVFIKAVNYIPRQHFADVDEAFYRRDMQLIKGAHLNSVGMHAHIQCQDCYHAANKEDILIFQDFALQWAYDSSLNSNPGFREKACQQISEMVYFLYNHPSVVYWCCHNEPPALFISQKYDKIEDYNNQVLDELLEETVKKIDISRPIHRSSGLGDDLHVYDGSLGGGSIYNARKQQSGFVSEFGFWSIAETSTKWGDIGWPPTPEELVQWSSRCGFFGSTSTFIGHPKYYSNRQEWIKASLLYGAFLAKYQTELFRSQKGNPINAIRWHFFADWLGYAGSGLVDVDRTPKLPYYWYKEGCRPLLVIADLTNTIFPPETALEIPIIAINDYAEPIEINWTTDLLEITGSQIIAGDPNAASLGGTGLACKRNHKVAIPPDETDILRTLIQKQGTNTIPANATLQLDSLQFTTPNVLKDRYYMIQLKWTRSQGTEESNWAHFMVGDINAKMTPGLHII